MLGEVRLKASDTPAALAVEHGCWTREFQPKWPWESGELVLGVCTRACYWPQRIDGFLSVPERMIPTSEPPERGGRRLSRIAYRPGTERPLHHRQTKSLERGRCR